MPRQRVNPHFAHAGRAFGFLEQPSNRPGPTDCRHATTCGCSDGTGIPGASRHFQYRLVFDVIGYAHPSRHAGSLVGRGRRNHTPFRGAGVEGGRERNAGSRVRRAPWVGKWKELNRAIEPRHVGSRNRHLRGDRTTKPRAHRQATRRPAPDAGADRPTPGCIAQASIHRGSRGDHDLLTTSSRVAWAVLNMSSRIC